jgi:hypothetical protein
VSTGRVLITREDAVEKGDMQMYVKVEAAVESLQKCDGTDLSALEFGMGAIARGHGLYEDLHQRTEHVLLERGQSPELEWERQNVLAQRHVRHDAIEGRDTLQVLTPPTSAGAPG